MSDSNKLPVAVPRESGILVVGSINADFVVRADHLPRPGESVVGSEFYQEFGGKGANQAVGIARLGVNPVTFVGAVGNDDIGRRGIASLQAEGIDCSLVKIVDDVASGVALIMIDSDGENCIAAAPGANSHVDRDFVETMSESHFRKSGLMVICQEVPIETIEVALQRAAAAGLQTVFNPAPPNPRLKSVDILRYVSLLTPNQTEVTAITGLDLNPTVSESAARQQQVDAIEALRKKGSNSIAITLGKQGCLVFDAATMKASSESVLVPAPQVTAVDTTAAGDAFNAAVATALYRGQSLLEACRFANRVAALSVTRKGAQPSMPKLAEVQ